MCPHLVRKWKTKDGQTGAPKSLPKCFNLGASSKCSWLLEFGDYLVMTQKPCIKAKQKVQEEAHAQQGVVEVDCPISH